MEKKDVIEFFDRCASWWDDDMIRNEVIITRILDNAGVDPGMDVLDVACGTGVLFPDYLNRGVKSVTGMELTFDQRERSLLVEYTADTDYGLVTDKAILGYNKEV